MSDIVERARAVLDGKATPSASLCAALVDEVEAVRAELALTRDGYKVRPMTETESNLMTQVLDLRRERTQLRATIERLRAELSRREPQMEQCEACGGRGTWEAECCNGSGGCSCRGDLVEMGSCHACGGYGAVEVSHQNPAANANFILNNHIGYPGGGPIGGGR